MAATPVALFLDYRAHSDFVTRTVMYVPVGEDAGRPVPYEQIWGLTQVIWLAAGVAVLFAGGWPKLVRNVQFVLLVLGLDVLVVASAAHGGIDSTTVLNLGATFVPYLAMIAVVAHPLAGTRTRRDLVTIACVSGAVVVALTIAMKALEGALAQRLQTFAFGTAPETGVVLAPLLLLVPAMSARRSLKMAAAVGLAAGLVLTQTRGGLIAAVVGGVVLVATGRLRLRSPAFIAVGSAGAAAVAYVIASRRSFWFTDVSTTYRRQNFDVHWHLFLHRPVLGYGISYGSLSAVRAAHNTLLSVADAGGIVLLSLWVVTWILAPLAAAFVRRRELVTASVGAAAIVAVVVGWATTGSDVFDYIPPTNLLPLMLGVALIGPVLVERLQMRVGVVAGVGLATAAIVASLGLTGVIRANGHTMPTALRARALVAAQELAFSSCGACSVVSLRQVAPEIVEARLGGVQNDIPSACFFVVPREYRPRRPGVLPPGMAWSGCTGTATESVSDWLKTRTSTTPGARARARSAAEEWLTGRCANSCRITSFTPLTSSIWRVETRPRSLKPSPCFYLLVDEASPGARKKPTVSTAAVSCDH